ncbi:MAG: hypothetical protein NW203_15610 [Hyphomonadaceae bacterium]|nr:hypothetical protein [Hyphomonadaceae bacterium]
MFRNALIALLILSPVPALAQDEPTRGMAVVGDDGREMARVADVERDAEGRIVAATFDGLDAPADAPTQLPDWPPPSRAPARATLVADAGAASQPARGGGAAARAR